jgi:hypothetical protein
VFIELDKRQGSTLRLHQHVQNTNAYHSCWKRLMSRFHGVAIRCLNKYFDWHRILDAVGETASSYRILTAGFGLAYQHSTVT